MCAKVYRDKKALPLVEKLKEAVKNLTIKCVQLTEQGRKLTAKVDGQQKQISRLTDKVMEKSDTIDRLQEKASDLERMKQLCKERNNLYEKQNDLKGQNIIDIGGREIEVLHTPGHSPGHLCFWEKSRGYLFTGDLVYKDILFAYYPSTDPEAYLDSLEKVAALPVKKVFPAHHSLDIEPEILIRMREAFKNLKADGKLHHGSGTFSYGDWGVWL